MQNGGGIFRASSVRNRRFAGTDPARPWASSCQLGSGVSPIPKGEGPGAPSVRFFGRRDRGHLPASGC